MMSFARFVISLAPIIKAFMQWLYERHNGNPKAAAEEMRQIQNHGAQLKNFQVEIDRQMAELEAARRAAGQG